MWRNRSPSAHTRRNQDRAVWILSYNLENTKRIWGSLWTAGQVRSQSVKSFTRHHLLFQEEEEAATLSESQRKNGTIILWRELSGHSGSESRGTAEELGCSSVDRLHSNPCRYQAAVVWISPPSRKWSSSCCTHGSQWQNRQWAEWNSKGQLSNGNRIVNMS